MRYKSLAHHLYQNHRTWTFRFRWPKDVRNYVEEQYEFHRSLKTIHLNEAIKKRDILLAYCKKSVRALRSGDSREFKILREIIRFQDIGSDEDILITQEKLDNHNDLQRLIDNSWTDIIKKAEDQFNPKQKAKNLHALKQLEVWTKQALSYGHDVPFDIHLEEWLLIRRDQVTPKTLEDGRLSITKFKKDFPTIEMVKRKFVREWFDNQITVYSPDRLKKFKQNWSQINK